VAVERAHVRLPPGRGVRGPGVGHRPGERLEHGAAGIEAGQVERQRGRRRDRRDPVPVGLAGADLEVGAEWPGGEHQQTDKDR
jgi:hypothetical protein